MQSNNSFYKSAMGAYSINYRNNYIDNLHEIFFEQIFEQIDYLSDQVRMARAYPQFLPQIVNIWKRRCHIRIVGPNTPFLGILDIEDYVFFMKHMADHFTELHVQEDGIDSFAEFYDYIAHLCDIEVTRFVNVESCILSGSPATIVDEDIRDLTVMLPNLKRLTSNMNLSGHYISGFKKLEQLVFKSVYHSVPLETRWMQEICLTMKQLRVLDITDSFDSNLRLYDIQLPNLEVLKINLSTVENIVSQVLQLPKLRTLAVRFDDSRQLRADQETIFQQIVVAKSECITRIALNNEVVQLPVRWQHSLLLELPKLRSLVCSNWNHDELFLDRRHIPCAQMQMLSFSGWEILRENQLLELVNECTQLTQLGLNGYHSTVDKLCKLAYLRYCENNNNHLQVYSDIMWSHLPIDEFLYWHRHDKYIRITCDGTDFDYQEDGFELDFV